MLHLYIRNCEKEVPGAHILVDIDVCNNHLDHLLPRVLENQPHITQWPTRTARRASVMLRQECFIICSLRDSRLRDGRLKHDSGKSFWGRKWRTPYLTSFFFIWFIFFLQQRSGDDFPTRIYISKKRLTAKRPWNWSCWYSERVLRLYLPEEIFHHIFKKNRQLLLENIWRALLCLNWCVCMTQLSFLVHVHFILLGNLVVGTH